ncbi:hypothetical protein Sjap_013323 [Stephania japonica]|uniref:Uncharacterized protein n=1 Tax=Stephania japonica TaxID=461633 RepID=A0AAP0J065_9MAGN
MDEGLISWKEVSLKVKKLHSDRQGAPHKRKPGLHRKTEEAFYANPYPDARREWGGVTRNNLVHRHD